MVFVDIFSSVIQGCKFLTASTSKLGSQDGSHRL
jgi:hypothetical protein